MLWQVFTKAAFPDHLQSEARTRVQEIVANFEFCQGGLLPQADEELHEWLQEAIAGAKEDEFCFLVYAAAMAGRRLQASLLPGGTMLLSDDARFAWVAWRMEGDVCAALLEAVEAGGVGLSRIVTALLVATMWWKQHRPEERYPKKLVVKSAGLSKKFDMSLQPQLYSGLIDLLRAGGTLEGFGTPQERVEVKRMGRRTHEIFLKRFKEPFKRSIPEKRIHQFVSVSPLRRAVAKIGRNDPCHCGSGAKHKDCCASKDRERLRHSSSVAGKTREEVESDPTAGLTMGCLKQMRPAQLLKLDPVRVPSDLQHEYLMRLGAFKRYDALADAFEKLGVPERLEQSWNAAAIWAVLGWKRELLQSLLKAWPEVDPKIHLEGSGRLLLSSDQPAAFLQTLETEALHALQSGEVESLADISRALLASPYRALGMLVARGEIPLVEPATATQIFDEILTARGDLDLPPDDEFGDFMEERSERERAVDGSAALLEKEKQLAATAAEVRRVNEELRKKKRELTLREKRARREAARNAPVLAVDTENMNELRQQVKRLKVLHREHSGERVTKRREMQRMEEEIGELRSAIENEKQDAQNNENGDEDFAVEGNQPLRLIEFPKGFLETLAGFPRHAGRATMNRLGQMAAGEPSAFKAIKQLKAYPEVLRARISDKYRLLYVPLPDRIRVVDLIRRADLDRRIERLQVSGLPATG